MQQSIQTWSFEHYSSDLRSSCPLNFQPYDLDQSCEEEKGQVNQSQDFESFLWKKCQVLVTGELNQAGSNWICFNSLCQEVVLLQDCLFCSIIQKQCHLIHKREVRLFGRQSWFANATFDRQLACLSPLKHSSQSLIHSVWKQKIEAKYLSKTWHLFSLKSAVWH